MPVPTSTVRIDWDNDGAFTQAIDDVSSRVHEAEWTRGRNADFSGDATGAATLVLWNTDDRFTPERNWCDNPSFESGTTGWTREAWAGFSNVVPSIAQVTDNAPSAGTKALEATFNGAATDQSFVYRFPYRFRAGVPHSLTFYVRLATGSGNVQWGLGSFATSGDRTVATNQAITTSWVQKTVTWTPSADRTDATFWFASWGAITATVRIDAVQVNAGTSANTYLEAPTRGQLVPGRPVHVYATYSATDYPQFFGYIQRLTPDPASRQVTITCYDVFQRMSETDVVVPANTFIQRSARDMRVEVLSDYERGTRNLCHNPSFEADTTGWTIDVGGTLTRITTDAAPGAGSACGEYAATATNQRLEFKLRQTPVFFAGQTYRLSLYLRTTSGTANWDIGLYTDVVSQIASKTVSVNTTWTRHTITYTLPATVSANDDVGTPQRLTVMLRSTGANTVRLDAVSVTRGQGLHPYADAGTGRWPNWCGNGSFDGGARNGWYDGWTNLVGNPSFETDATGWAVTASSFHSAASTITRSTAQAYIGTASGLVDVTGSGQGCHYVITGTFASGVTYHVRVALRLAVVGGASLKVGIGSNGTPTDKGETTTSTVDNTAWTTWTATWTPTADRTDVQVYVSGDLDFYVDAVQVVRRDPDTTSAPAYSNTGPGGGGSFTSNRVITTTQAKYGSRSHSWDTPATATAGRVYDFNHYGSYFVSGQTYTASVWLRPTSNMPYKVGIGGNKGDGTWDEASVTGTATANTWTQVTVTWTPTADRTSGSPFDVVLYIYQTDATARTVYLDGARVIPGSSADEFELAHWTLPTTGEATDVFMTAATLSGSAQAALADLNDLVLTRHYIRPAMASPFYTYVAADRDTLSSKASAETFDSEATAGFVFSQVDIDRSAVVNVVPVTYSGRTEYYSDSDSVSKYGTRPTGGIAGGSFFPDATVPDVVGPALVTRYKDPRPRPVLTVENRFPSQLQRELDDLITVRNDRTRTYNQRYLIVRVTTRVTQSGNRWTTTYQLEEHAY